MKKTYLLLSVVILLGLFGCAADLSSGSYEEGTVGQTQTIEYGTIVAAELVSIKGNSGVGGLAGGAAGAVGGSAIGGGGRSNLLGAIGGGLAGGLIGNAIDKKVNSQTGVRYIVQLDESKNVRESNISSSANGSSLTNTGSSKTSITRKNQTAKAIAIVQGLDGKKNPLPIGTRVMVLDGGTDRARVIPAPV